MLCQRCQSIHFREHEYKIRYKDSHRTLVHVLHNTRESFFDSVSAGCHFCTLLKTALNWYEEEEWDGNRWCREAGGAYVVLVLRVAVARHRQRDTSTASWDDCLFVELRAQSRLGEALLDWIPSCPDGYAEAQEIYHQNRPRPVILGTSNRETLTVHSQADAPSFNARLVQLWKDNCLTNHSTCDGVRLTASNIFPHRLIDVTGAPFLIDAGETSFEAGPYVTLSYCWGQGTRFLTLRENAQEHHRSIPTAKLPMTFRDAISVTKSLGYRYLWIDALCIIQDDEDDMRREIAVMGDTYRHAALTIAAQAAANANDGLFHGAKDPLALTPCRMRVEATGSWCGHIAGDATFTLRARMEYPNHLLTRGWALQEHILSPRSLVFEGQMRWSCLEATAAETRPVPIPHDHSGTMTETEQLRSWLYAPLQFDYPFWPETSVGVPGPFDSWHNVIGTYSRMDLTFHRDILRAVVGLAQVFSETHGSTFLAGLWKEDLRNGLMWCLEMPNAKPDKDAIAELRRKTPSWSWAAAGKASIGRAHPGDWTMRDQPIRTASGDYLRRPEVLDAFCLSEDPINTPASPPPGKIKPWGIRMRAPHQKLVLRHRPGIRSESHVPENEGRLWPHPDAPILSRSARLPDLNQDESLGRAHLDCPLEIAMFGERPAGLRTESDGTVELDVFCMPFSQSHVYAVCLLLVPHDSGDTGVYCRVAVAEVDGEAWCGSEEAVECEII